MIIFEKIFLRILNLVSLILGITLFRLRGVIYGKKLILYGLPIVSRFRGSKIKLGDHVVLCSTSTDTALGVNHPVVLRTLSPNAEINIGDDVGISGGSISAVDQIEIGARTMLGANVTIADTDFHDFSKKDCRYLGVPDSKVGSTVKIGENVFIGTNVIILKGVHIGINAVIGAGSVVTHDIPENVIAAGNPCKIIRRINLIDENIA